MCISSICKSTHIIYIQLLQTNIASHKRGEVCVMKGAWLKQTRRHCWAPPPKVLSGAVRGTENGASALTAPPRFGCFGKTKYLSSKDVNRCTVYVGLMLFGTIFDWIDKKIKNHRPVTDFYPNCTLDTVTPRGRELLTNRQWKVHSYSMWSSLLSFFFRLRESKQPRILNKHQKFPFLFIPFCVCRWEPPRRGPCACPV